MVEKSLSRLKMALVYSCCFWFSLRLGGIIIGLLSIVQATIAVVVLSIAYNHPQTVKNQIDMLIKNFNVISVMHYLESFEAEPQKYISFIITVCCIYIMAALLYIYAAYTCYIILMILFIFMELIRLIIISLFVTTWLIILKQNTMDIGLLIGASVASGFVLLGMFYLWVCAATLPILVIEMEREEQLATINKLQKLLDKSQHSNGKVNNYFESDNLERRGRGIFAIPSYNKYGDQFTNHYYASDFIH